jgi:hypothetical protein
MSEYRIDLMTDCDPARVAASEHFTARDDEAAARKAARILKRLATDPAAQYGDLWVRDADGGSSAEYVDTISLETTS